MEIPCFFFSFYFDRALIFLICLLSLKTAQGEITEIQVMTNTPANPTIVFQINHIFCVKTFFMTRFKSGIIDLLCYREHFF